jgi:F420-dependent oxidoreductase-like protein
MTTSGIGLVLNRPNPSVALRAIARAEQRGIAQVWSTVGGSNPDAVTVFAAAALRTQRITFGTAIVPVYPRHPLVLATQALVLADLAPGRFRLGVGPSHKPTVEGMFGIPMRRPLDYLREYVTVLRQLLWEGQAEYSGAFFDVHGGLPAGVTPPRTPILTSALRAAAFRLAGEVADGALSWLCPIPYLLQTALPALRAGAAAAGRPTPPLVAHVPVAVHTDRAAIRTKGGAFLGRYGRLPFYANMFADAGFPMQPDGSPSTALIDGLILAGGPVEVAARLRQIQEAGLPELMVMVVPIEDQESEEAALLDALAAQ